MADFIPLLQTLVWPLFVLIMLAVFRKPAGEIFELIKSRIESGSEFSVNLGQGGLSIGEAPKLAPVDGSNRGTGFEAMPGSLGVEGEEESAQLLDFDQLHEQLHLVHAGQHDDAASDARGRNYYRVMVRLDSDRPELLGQVNRVVYHLHPQIPDPVRESTSASNRFEIDFLVEGQFNLWADVYIAGQDRPVRLSRYLNF